MSLLDSAQVQTLRSTASLPASELAACLAKVESEGSTRTHALQGILHEALSIAAEFARAPVSGFQVGAAALGLVDPDLDAAALYLGANLEFAGLGLSSAVHAEQAVSNFASLQGEDGLSAIATSAAPCGHCRQFLCELGDPGSLSVFVLHEQPTTLAELLPAAFLPAELGPHAAWMAESSTSSMVGTDLDSRQSQAIAAAQSSYAPYTGGRAGVALEFADGQTAVGRLVESVAFNPSLPPLASALSGLALSDPERSWSTLRRCVFVEADSAASQRPATEAMLRAIAPEAEFEALAL